MTTTDTIVSSHIVEIARAPIKGNPKSVELDCLANQVLTSANSSRQLDIKTCSLDVSEVGSLGGVTRVARESRQLKEKFK